MRQKLIRRSISIITGAALILLDLRCYSWGLLDLLNGITPAITGTSPSTLQMGGAIQGTALTLTPTVSTFAGLPPTNLNADGFGGGASFNAPQGVVADDVGNLFVADANNNNIRKIVLATGEVMTIAGQAGVSGFNDGTGLAAQFNVPIGLATDGTSLYVADVYNHKIRKITPATGTLAAMTSANAVVTSLTGSPNTQGPTTAVDGSLAAATFNQPFGLAIDSTHQFLFVADSANNKIRKIDLINGMVYSLTGGGSAFVNPGAADNATATAVSFNRPVHLAINSSNTTLYVVDQNNNKIRQVDIATGSTSSLTGPANTIVANGAADNLVTPSNVSFFTPVGIAIDSTDNWLYVSDSFNYKIRQVAVATGATSSLTGTPNTTMALGFADGTLAASTFDYTQGITFSNGNLYVADSANKTIRKIDTVTSQVSTLAGVAVTNTGIDGTGIAARLDKPQMTTTDGINIYFTECGAYKRVRKMNISSGIVTTLAGNTTAGTGDGNGTLATFVCPSGITTDGVALYVADWGGHVVRKILPISGSLSAMTAPNAMVSTIAGTGVPGYFDDIGAAAQFNALWGITTDGINLYLSESLNNNIRKIQPTLGSLSSMTSADCLVSTLAGTNAAGAMDGSGTAASFNNPNGLTTDGNSLFVADANNNKIRKISPSSGSLSAMTSASAVVTSLTGTINTAMTAGAVDGTGAVATFNAPRDITTDGFSLYVVDKTGNRIRLIYPGSGTLDSMDVNTAAVSSLTGPTGGGVASPGYADGPGLTATFDSPQGITTDGVSLFIMDSNNNTVRKID